MGNTWPWTTSAGEAGERHRVGDSDIGLAMAPPSAGCAPPMYIPASGMQDPASSEAFSPTTPHSR